MRRRRAIGLWRMSWLAASVAVSACVGSGTIPSPVALAPAIVGGDATLQSVAGPPARPSMELLDPGWIDRASRDGAVILMKLRAALAPGALEMPGRLELGDRRLQALLDELAVSAVPAFPALPAAHARLWQQQGLDRWIALDVPPAVDLVRLWRALRSSTEVLPESLTLEDGAELRASGARFGSSPLAADPPRGAALDFPGWVPMPLGHGYEVAGGWPRAREAVLGPMPDFARRPLEPALAALGLEEAWQLTRGEGIGVAVVDSGVDRNHVALTTRLRAKLGERVDRDADGNGIAGDAYGVSFARVAILRTAQGAQLALGEPSDWSDWDGVNVSEAGSWGRGTVLAGLAAGSGDLGSPLGVAPGAWILPVDTQENLARPGDARRVGVSRRELPASREERRRMAPLTSAPWGRALGVVYAVSEGARVITCGWGDLPRQPILRDAIGYAQRACAVPVCAGALRGGDLGSLATLVSNPRNDGSPLPDQRTTLRGGPLVELGVSVGITALILSARPDLDAHAVAGLLTSAPPRVRRPGGASDRAARLSLTNVLARALELPSGRCEARAQLDREPIWRGRLKASGVGEGR